MATIWLTYAWSDNLSGDVDFVAQELEGVGLTVRLDRWDIPAGARLWDQISNFIQDPDETDAWAIFASQASLGNQPCREEVAYALDRALRQRSAAFPLIGIFTGPIDQALVPASVRIRLCVSTLDDNWKERVKAAAERREAEIARPEISPTEVRLHRDPQGGERRYAIEVRPRAGSWAPCFIGVLSTERESLRPYIAHGPKYAPPVQTCLYNTGEAFSSDGLWYFMFAQNEATPAQSYYLFVDNFPTDIVFGVYGGGPQYKFRCIT